MKQAIYIYKKLPTLQDKMHGQQQQISKNDNNFWLHLVQKNKYVQSMLTSSDTSTKQQASFIQDCLACLHVEINQFFENWEGAPIHRISAKHGLDSTCLPGGNAFPYNGGATLVHEVGKSAWCFHGNIISR